MGRVYKMCSAHKGFVHRDELLRVRDLIKGSRSTHLICLRCYEKRLALRAGKVASGG